MPCTWKNLEFGGGTALTVISRGGKLVFKQGKQVVELSAEQVAKGLRKKVDDVNLDDLAKQLDGKSIDDLARRGGRAFATAKEATEAAKRVGFRQTNFKSHGQPVFTDGKRFITPDVDGHSGGVWKVAQTVKDLGSKKTRSGTLDECLKRIGD